MNPLELPIQQVAELTARANVDSEHVELSLAGTADLRVTAELDLILQGIHTEMLSRGLKQVDVNLRELEFMNSSCFKSFVTWIGNLQKLPNTAQYQVRLVSDPDIIWQRRSLESLSYCAPNLIRVVAA
jgi:hypothetical protein